MTNGVIQKTNHENKQFNVLAYITVPLAIVVSIVCMFSTINTELSFFWLLPFIYAIGVMVLSYKNKNNNGIAYNIIHVTMFIRYVISVLLTVITTYYEGRVMGNNSYSITIVLMIYEMIVVFIVMKIYSTSRQRIENQPLLLDGTENRMITKLFIVFLVALTVVSIVRYPVVRNTLLNFTFTKPVPEPESLSSFVFVFFTIGVNVAYGLLIKIVAKLTHKNFITFIFLCILSIFFISSNWTGSGNINRWGLVTSAMVSYMVIVKNYPKYRNILIVIGGTAFIAVILMSSISKLYIHHGATGIYAVAEIFSAPYFNEYFQGIYPVANGLSAMQINISRINFITFLDDTISAYPWLNKLFYEYGNLTQTFYHSSLGSSDKILPTITQGYAHFGYVGAPIFSGLLTNIALRCDTSAKKTNNIYKTIAFTQIGVWCALFMAVNIYIIQRTTMYSVLLLILINIGNRVYIGGRTK